jgi:formate dehydrogenase
MMSPQTANPYGRPPGKKKGKARPTLKGRQVDNNARNDVKSALGDAALERDALIENLHLLQDRFGAIRESHLAALAAEMQLALAEVYEVATFYHAFEVVADDAPEPPAHTVHVCNSLVCAMFGADNLAEELTNRAGDDVRVLRGACMGRCEQAPVASVGERFIAEADAAKVESHIAAGENTDPERLPAYIGLEDYQKNGGYVMLRQCLSNQVTREEVVDWLEASELRGLGGAGFPTGRKWRFVMSETKPRILTVNADESEPGTFKDRYYLERDPHRFIEGMAVAAWAIEADDIYIYLRNEYPQLRALLLMEIDKARQSGLLVPSVHMRRGAGMYICGEESAMLESLEGKRGLPRHKPPFPSQVGLHGQPTLINNVETLYWVTDALQAGMARKSAEDPEKLTGPATMRSFSVSGRVKHPGVKLAPAGTSARQLIEEHCGGMLDGHKLAAYLPGGASGGIFPASTADYPLDFGSMEELGGFIGSAALIVLSDKDAIPAAVANLTRFFRDESCGQCTPCRVGTEKASTLMALGDWDREKMSDLADVMADASICGLGQAAANPIRCGYRYFPELFETTGDD